MADVTITNLTNNPILLQELYVVIGPNAVMQFVRERNELHSMPSLQQLWYNGIVDVDVVSDLAEDNFIDQKIHLFQGERGATLTTTRWFHGQTLTPGSASNAPGQAADLATIGSVMVASYTIGTDAGYRIFKIKNSYVSGAAFHVHWTKQPGAAGDGDQSGNSVRWRISYTVFESEPTAASDINVAPTVIDLDDTYDDAGTTTRLAHHTPNVAAPGFIAGHYVGICIEAVTPSGSALTCEPALITADLTYIQYINQ